MTPRKPFIIAALSVWALLLVTLHTSYAQSRGTNTSEYNATSRDGPASRFRDPPPRAGGNQELPPPEFFYARPGDDEDRSSVQPDARNNIGMAQAVPGRDPGRDEDYARARLREELSRIRARRETAPAKEPFNPPLPVRRKEMLQPVAAPETMATAPQSGRAVAAEIDRLVSDLLILKFTGTLPADDGPRTIRALLQSGAIAGVLIGPENIATKQQAKELMKSLQHVGRLKAFIAAQDAGGAQSLLTAERGFPSVPAQKEVASKGDPNYSYLAYQTLGSHLAGLGFNMNFGPWLGTAKSAPESFGTDALQVSVFAKTFILAHRESGVIPVPIVDMEDPRTLTLKALLVSFPDTPMSDMPTNAVADAKAFPPMQDAIRGPRFCFLPRAEDVQTIAADLKRGCDAFVVTFKGASLATSRQMVVQAVGEAISQGEVTLEQISASSQRLNALRASINGGRDRTPRPAPRTN